MARTLSCAPREQQLRMGVPHGHWKTITLTASLSLRGVVAPFVLDGALDHLTFETYVTDELVPELRTGDDVILDKLPAHKEPRVAALTAAAGVNGPRLV